MHHENRKIQNIVIKAILREPLRESELDDFDDWHSENSTVDLFDFFDSLHERLMPHIKDDAIFDEQDKMDGIWIPNRNSRD